MTSLCLTVTGMPVQGSASQNSIFGICVLKSEVYHQKSPITEGQHTHKTTEQKIHLAKIVAYGILHSLRTKIERGVQICLSCYFNECIHLETFFPYKKPLCYLKSSRWHSTWFNWTISSFIHRNRVAQLRKCAV